MNHAHFATDVDADGDLDFIVMNLDGRLRLLRNDLEAQHHSLGFSFSDRLGGCINEGIPLRRNRALRGRSVVEWYKIQPWFMAAGWAR